MTVLVRIFSTRCASTVVEDTSVRYREYQGVVQETATLGVGVRMRHAQRKFSMRATWLLSFVYLLGKGYVIPVCVRVIQIFTGTERVSG